jgi:hypothetical protein
MRRQILCLLVCAVITSTAGAAMAQGGFRQSDPNIGHFYMARQQWQIIEDAPVVTGQPGSPGGAAQQMAAPNRPVPLPKAGWMPYSSSIPSVQNALPQVNNGVPKPMPAAPAAPRGPSGMHGKAGNLSLKPKAPASSGPPTVKAYAPYKGYGGGAPAGQSAYTGGGSSASTNVKGSVLHWARPKIRSY